MSTYKKAQRLPHQDGIEVPEPSRGCDPAELNTLDISFEFRLFSIQLAMSTATNDSEILLELVKTGLKHLDRTEYVSEIVPEPVNGGYSDIYSGKLSRLIIAENGPTIGGEHFLWGSV